ncbi:MAG: amidohydrolase family protein [Pseudomonadota bacterium]
MYRFRQIFWWLCLPLSLQAQPPVADMHLHYKWTQQEVTTPAAALALLERENIVMGVVIGTPAALALELQSLAPEKIVPIFSPYREGGDWHRWAHDDTTVTRARAALASGQYYGIGELHVIGGFAPAFAKAGVLKRLLALAGEFDVPVMIHTELSRADFMLAMCQQFPDTRILWAHSGAVLEPAAIAHVFRRCGNVWGGLGARDPWRFVDYPLTAADGTLLPEWEALLLQYPDRFMAGSDPVWPVDQLDRWDEADTGWQELGRFWRYHRSWLAQLPDAVARRIRCENAVALFGRTGVVTCD